MKVYILPEVHAQIMFFVEKSNIEISGLGRIEKDSLGNMAVTKVYLLKQENTGASTDICESAAAELMYETREDKGALNFWWHSHVNMGVFWSGTDMSTIKQFGKNGYLLSTVFNKKGEMRSSYFQGGNGFLPELFIDDLKTEISHIPTAAQRETWLKEYEEKCKTKTYAPMATGYYAGRHGHASGLGYNEHYDGMDDYYPRRMRDVDYYSSGEYTTKPVTVAELKEKAAQIGMNFEEKNMMEKEQIEYIGINTGFTVDQMIEEMKKLFYMHKTPKIDDLSAEQWLMMYDVYLLIYGTDVDVTEIDTLVSKFYEQTMSHVSNLNEVEYELREAQYGYEDKKEEVVV